MAAEVTYNGVAIDQRVRGKLFKRNVTQVVNDPELVAYLENVKGFSVQRVKPAAASAAVPPAPAPAAAAPAEPEVEPEQGEDKPKTMPRGRRRKSKSESE